MPKPRPSQPHNTFWDTLRLYYHHCGDTRRLIPLQLGLLFVDAVLQVCVPAVIGYIIDQLQRDAAAFVRVQVPVLAPLVLLGALLFYAIAYTQHYLGQKIGQSVGVRFQVALYEHLQRLSADFYQRTHVGEITSRITNDINQGVMPLYNQLMAIFWAGSMVLASCASMFLLSRPLFLVFIAIILIFAFLTRMIGSRVRSLNREVRDEAGRINARITESISANTLIRTFGQEVVFTEDIRQHSAMFLTKVLRTAKVTLIFSDISNTFLAILAPLALLIVGAFFVGHGATVGTLVTAFGYWKTATSPVSMILNNITVLYASLASMDRVFEFFRETPLVKDAPGASPLRVTQGEIALRDVTFRYPVDDGDTVLNGLSLTIPARSSVALVGESGAGKSTIIQLLLRFYDPVAGQVCIDGQDVSQVTQYSLRTQVGLVAQETILLSGTIRDNMRLAKGDATDREIITALKHAEAWSFVKEMPNGLNTMLGERGARLSGGQKQRLSIARVFLKNPPIVILDEATSALDTITERQIQETMQRLYQGRTAVIVAHRLSTIIHCDTIVVLDHGRILAQGTHQHLLANCPRYREMCEKQAVTGNLLSPAPAQPEPTA